MIFQSRMNKSDFRGKGGKQSKFYKLITRFCQLTNIFEIDKQREKKDHPFEIIRSADLILPTKKQKNKLKFSKFCELMIRFLLKESILY